MPPSISDPAGTPGPSPNRRFPWPAEYYASATPERVLPSWATYGCGGGAVAIMVLVFVGGAWLAGGGFAQFLDLAFGMSLGEVRGMYTPQVSAEQKKAVEVEMEATRAALRNRTLPVKDVQPLLQTLQKVVKDEKVTPAEAQEIAAAARKAHRRGKA